MATPVNPELQGFPKATTPFVDVLGRDGQHAGVGNIRLEWLRLLISLWERTGQAAGGATLPPGSLADFAGPSAPIGWLLCDGGAISRTDYAALFNAIGTAWGAGDGSTTFNVPDLRGRVALGASGGHALGSTGGAESVTLSVAQLPAHNHGVTDPGHTHTVTDPGHHHTALVASSTNTTGTDANAAVAGDTGDSMTGISIDSATTGVTTQNTGSGDPVSTMSPFGAVLKIIKY